MNIPIRHNADWRFSTLTSWLAATVSCAYYADSFFELDDIIGYQYRHFAVTSLCD